MQECKNNNKYENFLIKDNGINCSQLGVTNCLDFSIIPTFSKPKKYERLDCSMNFATIGIKIKCCSKDTKVEYVDQIGNWDIENGEICGIGYLRCSFETIGYPCCTSLNSEVVSTDENGSWGLEDGEKCGFGELKTKYRIHNKKTLECLVTNESDTDKILLGNCDDTDYSTWYIKGNDLISAANDKCLYVDINSNDPALNECEKVNHQTHHQKNIEINFNVNDILSIKNNIFTICITNDNEQNQLCLNGKNLKFESLNEHSDWIIESLNSKIIFFIDIIIAKNPNLIKNNNN